MNDWPAGAPGQPGAPAGFPCTAMATGLHNTIDRDALEAPDASGLRVGIAVSEWNREITGALLDGAMGTLMERGVRREDIVICKVPGSFELIHAARVLALEGDCDAVIILGSVIRGETPHFDYICQGVTYGIAHLNATGPTPVIFGLLTTDDIGQARERSGGSLGNKGEECAVDAIRMATLRAGIRPGKGGPGQSPKEST